jgi:beta-aspartyl-peptidase (threonine type)
MHQTVADTITALMLLLLVPFQGTPGQEGAARKPNPIDDEFAAAIKQLNDQIAASDNEVAKKAVQKVVDDQAAAWNKGDLEGFMAGYWKSDELTFFSGKDITKGWNATLERYKKRYQSEGKEMGKLTFSDLKIEVLGPESAVVRGRFRLVTSKETPQGLFTLLFKKTADGWKIVHDHTSSG